MSHQIPQECTHGIVGEEIMGALIAWDLRYTTHPRTDDRAMFFHGVTRPFYDAMSVTPHFAANEPVKPPLAEGGEDRPGQYLNNFRSTEHNHKEKRMDTINEPTEPQSLPCHVQIGDKVTVELVVVGIQFTDVNVGVLLKMADGSVFILPADAVKLVPRAPVLNIVQNDAADAKAVEPVTTW